MSFRTFLRWCLFALYVTLFFSLPLTILWERAGFLAGVSLAVGFLAWLRLDGTNRIARRLGARPLAAAQAPQVFAVVREYCRRLEIEPPTVMVIETPAINIGLFGFDRKDCHLVLTRGALRSMNRAELAAVIGRELTYLWHGDCFLETWFSQFMSALVTRVSPERRPTQPGRRIYPFGLFLRQLVLYPLTIVPSIALLSSQDSSLLDNQAVRMTQRPRALSEGLRMIETFQERIPFTIPLSTRHLFLVPPPTHDPLGRIFFANEDISPRVHSLAAQVTHVGLT